ncbi:MAG: FmdB family zinc ribbon protein [Acidimicrobiales bacterium]
MPTYEYACTQCGQHLEVVQSFSDDPITTCAVCGGPMRKVFGTIGIVLKGSGFYKTDSRSSSSKSGAEAGGSKKPSDGEGSPSAPAKESGGSADGSSGTSSSGDSSSGDSSSGGSSAGAGSKNESAPAKASTT